MKVRPRVEGKEAGKGGTRGSATLGLHGAATLLTLTPGAAPALVTKNAIAKERRGSLLTTLGVNSSLIVHGTAVGLDISAILARSVTVFTVLNLATEPQVLDVASRGLSGRVSLNTRLDREGEEVRGTLALRPDEGTVVELRRRPEERRR